MPTSRARRTGPGLLAGLGLIGLDEIEPAIIAAVAAELPILLVGPHGGGKTLLLTRVAEALGLSWRHYNASLLSYDDLVGYPVPDGKGSLDWLRTPATIWGAQAVLLDEINRCRPDLQNKLFPIVHERRVQGIPLHDLRHRWAAMNPVDPDADDDPYLGAEPLDAALADRFAFVIPMPDWRVLGADDQERLLLSDLQPVADTARAAFRDAVGAARTRYLAALPATPRTTAAYVRHALRLLDEAGLHCSARRGATLVTAIAAVRATGLLDDGRAALVALRLGLPQRASGGAIHEGKILAAHKEALAASSTPADGPIVRIRALRDPLERALAALRQRDLDPGTRSAVVADGFAGLADGARHALAFHVFESDLADGLDGAVVGQLAEAYTVVATPQGVHETLHGRSPRHEAWLTVTSILATDRGEEEDALLENLLVALWGSGRIARPGDVAPIVDAWNDARARIATTVAPAVQAEAEGPRATQAVAA